MAPKRGEPQPNRRSRYVNVWASFTKPPPTPTKPIKRRRQTKLYKATICRICNQPFQQLAWGHRTTCPSQPWDVPGTKCNGIAMAQALGRAEVRPITFAKVINMPGMRLLATEEQNRIAPMTREQQYLHGDG
jgi:hypothetical protein